MAELKYVDWDGLVYYDGKIKQYIQDRDENYVKMGGIISFKELPDPTYYNLHYIYKITDEFTSNSRFDKAGFVYKAGTWVQCIDVHDDASRYRYTIFNEETIGGTADIDLSDYYTKKEVDEQIEEAINKIDVPDVNLDDYYTKSEVDDLLPDLTKFVDKEYVDELFEQAVTEGELSTLTNTVADIQESVEELSQQLETLDFVTPEELEDAIKNIEHPVVDLEGYATEDWVNQQGFLKEHQDLSEYAKKSDIPQVEAVVDSNNDITGLTIGTNTYDFDNFATTETVNQINENIQNNYVTNDTLTQNYITEEEIANTYITEEHVSNTYVTLQDAENTYVSNEQVKEVVATEVETVVTEQIETKVTEVIEQKIEAGEIIVNADSINYDTWD